MKQAVPAPGTPTVTARFVGGFRQAWGEALAPTLGRVALAAVVVVLVGIGAIAVLATVYG